MYSRVYPTGNRLVTSNNYIVILLLLTIRLYPIVLSLTGSWSDRTAVVDIIVVQVAVAVDIEHISIAAVEIVRRERPNKYSPQNKEH